MGHQQSKGRGAEYEVLLRRSLGRASIGSSRRSGRPLLRFLRLHLVTFTPTTSRQQVLFSTSLGLLYLLARLHTLCWPSSPISFGMASSSSLYRPGRSSYSKLLVLLTTAIPQIVRVGAAPLVLDAMGHERPTPPGSKGERVQLALQHYRARADLCTADFYFKLGLAAG